MKKLIAVILVLAMLLTAAACGKTSKPAGEIPQTGEYTGKEGWKVKYDPELIYASEIKGGAKFEYTGKVPGECSLQITYEDGKQPNECLSEHTGDWDESQYRYEGYAPGTEDKWAYTRLLSTKDGDTDVYHQFTGTEFGSGVLLFEFLTNTAENESDAMAASDALAAVVDSITYEQFPMQTELSFYEGTYIQKYEEELEDVSYKVIYYIQLNEDHTGTMSIQDEIPFVWTSNQLISIYGDTYDFTIEGDMLYVDLHLDEWEEFERTIPPYYYIGHDDIEARVYNYLSQNVGNVLAPDQICIPVCNILKVDDTDKNDIKVYGDFWVFDYELEGDTLMCVAGGDYPGCIHLKETEHNYEVTGYDMVEDGSGYTESAKKIFGDLYDKFTEVQSDTAARDAKRREIIKDYVHANYLDKIKYYKDYGWDAVAID